MRLHHGIESQLPAYLDLELLDEPADTAQAITRSQWRKINDQDLDDGLDI